jgi:hypothetical protein
VGAVAVGAPLKVSCVVCGVVWSMDLVGSGLGWVGSFLILSGTPPPLVYERCGRLIH